MTSTNVICGFSEASLSALAESQVEPAWMRERRQSAWRAFQSQAMPGMNEEEWRRTDIRALKLEEFSPALGEGGAESGIPAATFDAPVAAEVCTIDGVAQRRIASDSLSSGGVHFGTIEQSLGSHGELLERCLHTRCVDPVYDKFASLHAAFLRGGAVLYVPRGQAVSEPLLVRTLLTSSGLADTSHLLIVLEEGASATLVHELHSADEIVGLHAGAVEVVLQRGANLQLVELQHWGPKVWHFSHQRAIVEADASLQWTTVALGSRLAKVNQEVVLDGRGASAEMNGVMVTSQRQHLSYHTRQDHRAEHTHSDLLYGGALRDRSRIVWRGMIRVERGAQKTDAYQRNDSLVLSEQARADSIPGLEIEADDVRCTHGATVGRVDENQIFYGMARGLTRDEATHLIVEGFFNRVYDRLRAPAVRRLIQRAVARRVGVPEYESLDGLEESGI